MHGDHWHGSLPSLTQSGTHTFTAFIRDEDEHAVVFNENNAFRVSLAPGALSGIVTLESHTDYVIITALSNGSTQLVFEWLAFGEVVYTTPPITIRVVE